MRRIVQTDTHADSCVQTTCVPCWSCLLCLTSQKPRATCLNRVREQQRQNAGGICCRGRHKQPSSSERQGLAGACPGRSVWGLYWPWVGGEGNSARLGVFSVPKLGQCESMTGPLETTQMKRSKQRDSTTHLAEEWKFMWAWALSTETFHSTTPSAIKSQTSLWPGWGGVTLLHRCFCFVSEKARLQSKGESRSLTVRNMLQLLLWEVRIIGVTCLCTGELSLCGSPSCPEAQTRWPSELVGKTMTSDLAAWSSWPGPSWQVLSSVDACTLLWWTFFQVQASYNVVASCLDLVSKVLCIYYYIAFRNNFMHFTFRTLQV